MTYLAGTASASDHGVIYSFMVTSHALCSSFHPLFFTSPLSYFHLTLPFPVLAFLLVFSLLKVLLARWGEKQRVKR